MREMVVKAIIVNQFLVNSNMQMNNVLILNIVNSGISLIMGFYMLFLHRNFYKLGTGYWAAGSLIFGV
jgi:hypothetical protein